MHLDVVACGQKRREVAEADVERHLDMIMPGNLPEQIGDDRVDGTDSRFGLAGLRRYHGSEKAGDLRHLADPGIAFTALDKSQRSGRCDRRARMSLHAIVRAQAHRATSLHGKSISASDRAPFLLTNVRQTAARLRHSCSWRDRNAAGQTCTVSEQDRFSPSHHFAGPRRFLLFFCRTRALHSLRVSTCSRDASTQAALLGAQSAINN